MSNKKKTVSKETQNNISGGTIYTEKINGEDVYYVPLENGKGSKFFGTNKDEAIKYDKENGGTGLIVSCVGISASDAANLDSNGYHFMNGMK